MRYLIILTLILGCSSRENETIDTIEKQLFTERHRPQYHFTPPSKWMNDPNGMVYYEGEYHLFYQFYPDSNVWGPMHWGHAVSRDMISWEHLPIALYPDSLGLIFSGSAVIDWNNTTGFGEPSNPPMVAIFTHHLLKGEQEGGNDFQVQSIAYSLDKGRSWEKYDGNPVIPSTGIRDFRDPKVIWHEESQRWVMALSANDRVKFYTSPDLKAWEFASDFGPGQGSPGRPWECPDIFPLTDEKGVQKWVLIVSVQSNAPNKGTGTSYFIGDFDGHTFTNDDPAEYINWLDYGTDNYAFVTWSDIPKEDGRRLGIGWMSNWQYAQVVPTEAWRSAMTLPRSLKLVQTEDGYRLHSPPVREIETYIQETRHEDDSIFVVDFKTDGEFKVEISNNLGELIVISAIDGFLRVDRTNSGVKRFFEGFAAEHTAELESIVPSDVRIFVDASSVEVFVNEGALVMTEIVFPSVPYTEVSTSGTTELTTRSVRSIWK